MNLKQALLAMELYREANGVYPTDLEIPELEDKARHCPALQETTRYRMLPLREELMAETPFPVLYDSWSPSPHPHGTQAVWSDGETVRLQGTAYHGAFHSEAEFFAALERHTQERLAKNSH